MGGVCTGAVDEYDQDHSQEDLAGSMIGCLDCWRQASQLTKVYERRSGDLDVMVALYREQHAEHEVALNTEEWCGPRTCDGPGCKVEFEPAGMLIRLHKQHRFCSKSCQRGDRRKRVQAQRAKQVWPLQICCKRCARRVPWRASGHLYCASCYRIIETEKAKARRHADNPDIGTLICTDCKERVPRTTGTQKRCEPCRSIRRKAQKQAYNAKRLAARRAEKVAA